MYSTTPRGVAEGRAEQAGGVQKPCTARNREAHVSCGVPGVSALKTYASSSVSPVQPLPAIRLSGIECRAGERQERTGHCHSVCVRGGEYSCYGRGLRPASRQALPKLTLAVPQALKQFLLYACMLAAPLDSASR